MTHQIDYTFPSELVEQGLAAVPELMRILINNVMQVERSLFQCLRFVKEVSIRPHWKKD
jgi:hypothetical protein